MTTTPRCTSRGCPVRYRGGPDRPCPLHQDHGDTLAARIDASTAAMAAPGETTADTDGDQDDGGPVDKEPITLGEYLKSVALRPPASL